jgi:hypothetical protein
MGIGVKSFSMLIVGYGIFAGKADWYSTRYYLPAYQCQPHVALEPFIVTHNLVSAITVIIQIIAMRTGHYETRPALSNISSKDLICFAIRLFAARIMAPSAVFFGL